MGRIGDTRKRGPKAATDHDEIPEGLEAFVAAPGSAGGGAEPPGSALRPRAAESVLAIGVGAVSRRGRVSGGITSIRLATMGPRNKVEVSKSGPQSDRRSGACRGRPSKV